MGTAMLISAIAAFFKYKIVGSVIVLACWPLTERLQIVRGLSRHGLRSVVSCDPNILDRISHKQLQGVLYFNDGASREIEVQSHHYGIWYKWLVIANGTSTSFNNIRYDSDLILLEPSSAHRKSKDSKAVKNNDVLTKLNFKDVYAHPSAGVSIHPWAIWNVKGELQLQYEEERIDRRLNLQKYPFRLSTPMSRYVEGTYNGTFFEYVSDLNKPTLDSNLGAGFAGSQLLVEALNATEVIKPTLLWTAKEDHRSIFYKVATWQADISGAGLRMMLDRIAHLDYVLPMWTTRIGFTYLAERDSNGNMFVMPFDASVWWCCLGIGIILALMQRLTARTPAEKHGAVTAVLATALQQDAEYPEGTSGRFTFMILSIWSMIVYAYYSSSIVSALMSAGKYGPETLTALADSKYSIFSDDYDYIRDLMFERNSHNTDLEYLKKKKKRSSTDFYQSIKQGVEIVRSGTAAYHAEFNNFYQQLNTLADNQVCKLSYIDTLPAALLWTAAPKRSPFTEVLRIVGCKIHERGLAHRVLSQWRIKPAPCRAALLAEQVKFSDVATLLAASLLGLLTAVVLMLVEVFYARWKENGSNSKKGSNRRNLDDRRDSTFWVKEFVL